MSSASESGSDKVIFQKSASGRCSQVLDDAEFVKMYDRTTSKTLNKSLISATNDNAQTAQKQQQNDETHKWKIGDQCMALYEADGKWYPAIIEEISPVKNKCTVSYVGYDQKAVLKLEEILAEAEFAANFPHFRPYFDTSQPISLSDKSPPAKRRRIHTERPIMEFGGFFKVPDIPQHILEGKGGPRLWEGEGRRNSGQRRHKSIAEKSPATLDEDLPLSSDYSAYLRFLFRTVPRQPSIGPLHINELYERSAAVAERFFVSFGSPSTHSSPQAPRKFMLEINCHVDKEKNNATLDYSKIPGSVSENTTTVSLYLEGIHDKLRPNIDSDVEAADEVGNEHEAEGTSGTNKIVNNDVKKDAFPIPDLCPPPPPSMFGKVAVAGNEKEALTNMLMSWYMSGYHTGFYQGVMHEKMSCQKPK